MPERPGRSVFRSLGLLSVGFVVVIATLIGAGLGFLLDKWLGTGPWLMIVCLFLGLIAGFREMMRMIEKYGDE